MIVFRNGNILTSGAEAVVNTVNCQGVMGKGLALAVKQKYPSVFEAYAEDCRGRKVRVGFVRSYLTLERPQKTIVNFPTKDDWRLPSCLGWIERGLVDLRRETRYHHIRSIAIPPLGCGLGGLDWKVVKPRIIETFRGEEDLDVEIWERMK